jgi:hypothetical protein
MISLSFNVKSDFINLRAISRYIIEFFSFLTSIIAILQYLLSFI